MSKKKKVFSGIDSMPSGMATEDITKGCMVLEGGAFRAVYGEGVLDALMEAGINMQCTAGVSAGALNGMHYVAGHIGRAARINLSYRHDSRYVGMTAVRNNKGIIGFDFAFDPEATGYPFDYDRFYDKNRRFVAVATSVEDGTTKYFEKGVCSDILAASQASASMPYVSKPVMVDGIPCLDGGCSVKIPYQWAIDQGFDKIVIVMTREASYRRKNKADEKAIKFYRKHPEFGKVLSQSAIKANEDRDEIDRLAAAGRVFVIAPSEPVDAGRLEPDMEKLGELYYLGYDDGEAAVPKLKEYLGI